MAPANSANKKVANSLVALSSAAVLAVYAAGYVRTRSAADRFALLAADRRVGTQNRPDPDGVKPDDSIRVRLRPDAKAEAPSAPAVVAPPAHTAPAVKTPKPKTIVPAAEVAPVAAAAPAPLPVAEPTPPEPVMAAPAPQRVGYKDGTYLGWGHCRHGDIQASVVIASGRIVSATIAQCLTRYSCSIIEKLPPQVAQRQAPDVDTISGATESGDAFYYAVLDALYLAK
jgi:uncharacterized protein with FMN-binding domain